MVENHCLKWYYLNSYTTGGSGINHMEYNVMSRPSGQLSGMSGLFFHIIKWFAQIPRIVKTERMIIIC